MKLSHRRRAGLGAVLTAILLAASGFAASAAGAVRGRGASAPPVMAGSRYLALGDSVTFGYEEPQVVPAPDYADAASFPGYPEQLGSELHLNVANAACPGETSSSLISVKARSNGCENSPTGSSPGYRALYPLHVSYKGSQLAFALAYLHAHRDVRLVSLMIGANDYFVCEETTKDACSSPAEKQAVLATVSKNVQTILGAIRNKAHYKGQLAIVNYYSLDYGSAASNRLSELLNHSMDAAARPFHALIADGFSALEVAAVHSAGSTCNAGLLTQLGAPGKCGIHPSYAGQALLAQALERVIRL